MNTVSGRKISTSMIIFGACVLALGLGLFAVNYYHATACASDRSPDEIDEMVQALKNRLLESESQVLKNEILMNKLINAMQSNLFKLEQQEYQELQSGSAAVEIALLLAQNPAPPMPVYPLDEKYLDAEVLADAIDVLFAKDESIDVGGDSGFGAPADQEWEQSMRAEHGQGKGIESFAINDADAMKACSEWKTQYHVIVGTSWGDLPFDLQETWFEYSCDAVLSKDAQI
jgi:hypothetical protein